MDYKEKLELARDWYNDQSTTQKEKVLLESIFPELKESEVQRIRKWLIDDVKDTISTGNMPKEYEHMAKTAIAWLEKQGEHIKFLQSIQIGDEVTRNLDGVLVNLSQLKRKAKQGSQNLANSAKTCKNEPKFKVGDTIKPKDGGHEPWQIMQVDILDKKYRFKDGYVIHFSQEDNYELVEQSSAWSEKDEKMLEMIISDYTAASKSFCGHQGKLDWLKSLKERCTWKPSDYQLEALESATENCAYSEYQDCLRELIVELKKLKG